MMGLSADESVLYSPTSVPLDVPDMSFKGPF